MSPQTWQRVKSLYHAASELPSQQQGEELIRERAAGDPKVEFEALRLLRADSEADGRISRLQVPKGILKTSAGSLQPGQVLDNRYEIRRYIAEGGFGEVYEAEDLERGEAIAVKLLKKEFATSQHLPWLRREVLMARRIQHPNVCRVFDVVQSPEAVFLTMELLPGQTVAQILKRDGAMNERRALPIIRQIVAALAAAHASGVVHRDLKPGNIILVPRPHGADRAVVTDFGMARQASNTGSTLSKQSSTMAFGTPAYMAPEQISGKSIGPAADIYSLGVMMFEMLTGELPFDDDSPLALAVHKTETRAPSAKRFAPALRDTWARAIQKCLSPKPESRFQDVRELLEFLESRSKTVVYKRLAVRGTKRLVRSRTFAAACVGVLILTGLWIWANLHREPGAAERQVWLNATYALQSNEPLSAMKQLLSANEVYSPSYRARAEIALAFHLLDIRNRSEGLLGGLSSWLAPTVDRQYGDAVRAYVRNDPPTALAILKQRSEAHPNDAMLLADLAFFETLVQKTPSRLWKQVARLKSDHPAAYLAAAQEAMLNGDWAAAERAYLTADTFFRGQANELMIRAVSSRRGLASLANGNTEAARAELVPFSTAGIAAPHTGTGTCEHYVTLTTGINDRFQGSTEPMLAPSDRLSALIQSRQHRLRLFDSDPNGADQYYGLSFPLPPLRFCSAQLSFRIRRSQTIAGADNDTMSFGAAPFETVGITHSVHFLWGSNPSMTELEGSVDIQAENLANIQRAYASRPTAFLDILAGDDTDFDYLKLTLVY